MIRTTYISLISVIVLSCSDQVNNEVEWSQELIGVGYIGEHRDSLNYFFSYSPHENKQPGKLKEVFKYGVSILKDTITIHNHHLYGLFREIGLDKRVTDDSSTFLIDKDSSLFRFTKIKGHDFVPDVIYFDKSPSETPDEFSYHFVDGFDYFGNYEIELSGKDSIKVWLKSGSYIKYIYEQYEYSEIDKRFISSYLNLACQTRYDTITYSTQGAVFCGSTHDEIIVYNDSLFRYNTYFRKRPGAGILAHYFRSKINSEIHELDDVPLEIECPFKPRDLRGLPVALENWKIMATD